MTKTGGIGSPAPSTVSRGRLGHDRRLLLLRCRRVAHRPAAQRGALAAAAAAAGGPGAAAAQGRGVQGRLGKKSNVGEVVMNNSFNSCFVVYNSYDSCDSYNSYYSY